MLARADEHALIHGQDLCTSPQGAQLWCQHWIGEFSSLHTLGPLVSGGKQGATASLTLLRGCYAVVTAWGQPFRPCTAKEPSATSVEA